MSRTIITTDSNTEQCISRDCTKASIKANGNVWCNIGNAHCMYLECTEKNNKINVKVIK